MAPKNGPGDFSEDGDPASYGLVPASYATVPAELLREHMLSTTLSRADAQDVLTSIDDELHDIASRSNTAGH